MNLMCTMESPCPHQNNTYSVDICTKNEGYCEYQEVDILQETGGGNPIKYLCVKNF